MTRTFLAGMGVTDDASITKILNAHHEELQTAKDAQEKAEKELRTIKVELEDAKKPKDGAENWEQKFNDEVLAHKTTKDGYAAEKTASEIDSMVSAALKDAKMNEAAIPKALKLYDRKIVTHKDGKITNADKVLEHFKSEWKDFFMTESTIGTKPSTPPPPGGSGTDSGKANAAMNSFILAAAGRKPNT